MPAPSIPTKRRRRSRCRWRTELAQTQIAQYQGTGKRKTSVARVILRPGDGATWFNGRTIEEYFPRAVHRQTALAPLKVAELEGRYDIRVRVHGGGPSGQAGAVRSRVSSARRWRGDTSEQTASAGSSARR